MGKFQEQIFIKNENECTESRHNVSLHVYEDLIITIKNYFINVMKKLKSIKDR